MRRVLIIAPSDSGTIAKISANIKYMFEHYSDCQVLMVSFHRSDSRECGFEHCKYFIDGHRTGRFLSMARRVKWLKKIKMEYAPDVSISTLTGCSTYNVLTATGEKLIGIFHAPTCQLKNQMFNYILAQLSFCFLFGKLDALFCVSEGVTDYLTKHYRWIKKDKIRTVYNVHLVNAIREMSREDLDDVYERSLFENRNVFLYCGRLDVNKSPERLLKAFAASSLDKESNSLVFIGSEWDYSGKEIGEIASKLNIGQSVAYLGIKKNPYKYMARAKALVSTSISEGLPGVIIESLILRKPVLTTNSSRGVWEILGCSEKYERNLTGVYIAQDGIITSNLPIKDEDINIKNLADALPLVLSRDVEFKFESSIDPQSIISEYLGI